MTHGTRWCYANGCRLPECKLAAKRYEQRYKQGKRIKNLVDASEARSHLQFLRANRLPWRVVEEHSGLTHVTVWRIFTGKATRTTKTAAEGILGIGLHHDPRQSLAGASQAR